MTPSANPARRCYLVTVGTSLLKLKTDEWKKGLKDYPAESLGEDEAAWKEGTAQRLRVHESRLQQDAEAIRRMPPARLPKASAELAALYGQTAAPFEGGLADEIHLIGTRTQAGEYCAEALRQALALKAGEAGVAAVVETHYPEFLGSAEQKEFADRGLPRFLNLCFEIADGAAKRGLNVVLVPNGGYKTLIAYLTLLGLLRSYPIWYVYEDSDTVLTLPHLPVGLDIPRWRRIRFWLNLLEGTGFRENDPIYVRADMAPFRTLVERNQDGLFALTSLARALEQQYLEVTGSPQLSQITSRTTLLGYLRSNEGVPFAAMIQRLSGAANVIWLGDRVPTMIDHAQRHHADLFDIAERILLPLFWWHEGQQGPSQPFLQPHELFALMGALYLHDCGHVVDALPEFARGRRLGEPEIRDYHHILGYLRLREGALRTGDADPMLSAPLYDWLLSEDTHAEGRPWSLNPDDGRQGVWQNFLQAVATLGVYHRRRTMLDFDAAAKPQPFPAAVEPLTDQNGNLKPLFHLGEFRCGSLDIPPPRMRLLACLLRMIDCLDQQASRTGPEHEIQFHLDHVRRERDYARKWMDASRPVLESAAAALDGSPPQPGDPELGAWFSARGASVAAVLAAEYRLKAATHSFLSGQESHFAHKKHVRRVSIQPILKGKEIVFHIRLEFLQGVSTNDRDKASEAILSDVRGEYENPEVQETLEDAGIRFEF